MTRCELIELMDLQKRYLTDSNYSLDDRKRHRELMKKFRKLENEEY